MKLKMRPTVPEPVNERIAIDLFGWKWMAWIGLPTSNHPEYVSCRNTPAGGIPVRQFMSPEQLANKQWQGYFKAENAYEAKGDEALDYTYCSSGCSAEIVPDFQTDDDALVLKRMRELRDERPELWERFSRLLSPAVDYEPGEYTACALFALGHGRQFFTVCEHRLPWDECAECGQSVARASE